MPKIYIFTKDYATLNECAYTLAAWVWMCVECELPEGMSHATDCFPLEEHINYVKEHGVIL